MNLILDFLRAESPAVLALLASTLVFLGEWRVHRYNYDYLMTVGGEELIPRLMQRYYWMVAAMPAVIFLSTFLVPKAWTFLRLPLAGIILVMLSFALRIWALRMLGRLWTQRCVFIGGMPRVQSGPYRFLRHPEYTARAVEGIGFLLFFGCNLLGILFWLRSLFYLMRILKVESRQLYELSPGPLHLAQGSSTVGTSKL